MYISLNFLIAYFVTTSFFAVLYLWHAYTRRGVTNYDLIVSLVVITLLPHVLVLFWIMNKIWKEETTLIPKRKVLDLRR